MGCTYSWFRRLDPCPGVIYLLNARAGGSNRGGGAEVPQPGCNIERGCQRTQWLSERCAARRALCRTGGWRALAYLSMFPAHKTPGVMLIPDALLACE